MSDTTADNQTGLAALQPSNRSEDWRYLDLRQWQAAETAEPQADADALALLRSVAPALADLADANTLIWRDGALVQGDLPSAAPADVTWLAGADDQSRAIAEQAGRGHLLRLTGLSESPRLLIALTTGGSDAWRLTIDAAPGAVADLVIVHLHAGSATSGALIEVSTATDAAVRIDELCLATPGIRIGRALVSRRATVTGSSSLAWATAGTGGACQRCVTTAAITGPHGECRLGGARVVAGNDQAHHLIRLAHEAPNASSRQFVKHVAGGRGRAGFDGRILVVAGADGTDAEQQNANLQLTPTARVSTRPQLDIFADEVSAAHGATVGQPDDDQIRYLQARGIDAATALSLVTDGFVAEAIAELHHPAARDAARSALLNALHQA